MTYFDDLKNLKEQRKEFNVYHKLILARHQLLDEQIKQTGKNIHLEFKYFQLADFVPSVIRIFNELGLISLTSFTDEEATMAIVNCDNPTEKIVFTSPMREVPAILSRDGKAVNNPMQTLGGVETYQRRYLYLVALDLVVDDEIDSANSLATPEAKTTTTIKRKSPLSPTPNVIEKPVVNAPKTTEERQEIKEKLTAVANENASEETIQLLKDTLKELIVIDPEQKAFVSQIAVKTENLTKITNAQALNVIKQIKALIKNIKEKGNAK